MQKYKNILITGSNSFLGTNVALELSGRSVHQRAIVRHSNPILDSIQGIEIIKGRVQDFDDLNLTAQGCDCIVHIASVTSQALPRYSMYRDFNVGATQNVIRVARANNIQRVVYVSSANTIGNGTLDTPSDETREPQPPYSTMYYGRSKIEAESVLRQASDLDWTIINPTYMLGANDTKPSSGAIIFMGYGKRWIWATPGGKNIISVDAAAKALCNAIERGKRGENYLLAGEAISIADFFRHLNPSARILVIPRSLLICAGYVGDLLRAIGLHTQLSVENMKVVCSMEYYRADKATLDLDLEKTDLDQCIAKAVEWFKSQNMLP